MDWTFSDEHPVTTIMQSEESAPDPRASLMERVATLAGQIYCARGGEPIGNRSYGAADAIQDASKLLTIALNAGQVEHHLAKAAESLKLPTIWPSVPAEDPSDEEPFSGEPSSEEPL